MVAIAAAVTGDREYTQTMASQSVSVTRDSKVLETHARSWADVCFDAINTGDADAAIDKAARQLGYPKPRADGPDEVSACYLNGSLPSTFNMLKKYSKPHPHNNDVWTGLLANANTGGENVHRGALLGAVLGAQAGLEGTSDKVFELYDKKSLEKEIDNFVKAVIRRKSNTRLEL